MRTYLLWIPRADIDDGACALRHDIPDLIFANTENILRFDEKIRRNLRVSSLFHMLFLAGSTVCINTAYYKSNSNQTWFSLK